MRRVLLGPLLALLLGTFAQPVGAGWWDDLDRGQSVELEDVVAKPSRYQGRVLSFFCIFHRKDEVFAPLATPYSPQRYENLAVWPDGKPIWEKKVYERDYPFLYIARSHPQLAELLAMETFTRIEVTGRIRGTIRARPCIEIESVRRTGHRLGRHVVDSVVGGDQHSEAGRLELAYEWYRRALTPDLPPTYDLYVRRRLADSLRRLGRHAEADQVQGGEIVGEGAAPEPGPRPVGSTLGDPLPGEPLTPGAARDNPPAGVAPPIARDLPGVPIGSRPFTPPNALPGQPSSPSVVPPVPTTPQPVPGAPASATAPAPIAPTLPGTPIAPTLPGTPVGPPPPVREAPRIPEEEQQPPPAPPLPSGAPPRAPPRLTGVK